jgi:hypothetical protein
LERDNLSLSQGAKIVNIVNKDPSGEMSVAASLCQSVLDALTDVDMPKRHPTRWAQGSLEADGICLPVYGIHPVEAVLSNCARCS